MRLAFLLLGFAAIGLVAFIVIPAQFAPIPGSRASGNLGSGVPVSTPSSVAQPDTSVRRFTSFAELESAASTTQPGQRFVLRLSEADVTGKMREFLASDRSVPITNATARLRPGRVTVSGQVSTMAAVLDATAVGAVRAESGHLSISIESMSFGGNPPAVIQLAAGQMLTAMLTRASLELPSAVETIEIGDGELIVRGVWP